MVVMVPDECGPSGPQPGPQGGHLQVNEERHRRRNNSFVTKKL